MTSSLPPQRLSRAVVGVTGLLGSAILTISHQPIRRRHGPGWASIKRLPATILSRHAVAPVPEELIAQRLRL
jgi:hypothetical protein